MRILPANVIPVYLNKGNDASLSLVSGLSAEILQTVTNLTAETTSTVVNLTAEES